MPSNDALSSLRAYLAPIVDLDRAAAVLHWDQRTYMPPGGASARADQLATLSRLKHELAIAPALEELLDAAHETAVEDEDRRLIQVARRDFGRARRLPAELVAELSHARSIGNEVWAEARACRDWSLVVPSLARIVDLVRSVAEHAGYPEHPYDALLDDYEPGMTTAQVSRLFDDLKRDLVPLVQQMAPRSTEGDDACLRRQFDPSEQLAFGLSIARAWGFDLERGRQDQTLHPFCTAFGPDDVRITTRISAEFLSSALFGTLHETGHALYEQGIPRHLARSPLGQAASLGVHESQSRLWEHLVGRSRTFWERNYAELQRAFPAQLGRISTDTFYRAINTVKPTCIRVEADELTYNLHIFLRFELELALIEGRLDAADIPGAWNQGMVDLLGIVPPDDALGALQDVHWGSGLFGYFPTYTIGNVLSVQLWEAAQADDPLVRDEISSGQYGRLLQWLREHVHRHGRQYLPAELVVLATGRELKAEPYLHYLRTKFGALYDGASTIP